MVQASCGEKALGLDGFMIAFFNHCWVVVRVEVLATLQPFMSVVYSKKSLNETIVSLIPKKGGASNLNNFRPISL